MGSASKRRHESEVVVKERKCTAEQGLYLHRNMLPSWDWSISFRATILYILLFARLHFCSVLPVQV